MCLKDEWATLPGVTLFRHKEEEGGGAVAYVREKKVRNKETGKTYGYYQLVEGVRENGKVRQKVLAHLGEHRSLEAAMLATGRLVGAHYRASYEGTDKASRIEAAIRERWGDQLEEHRYALRLPMPEEVVRRAYPRGWPEHPRRGQKFRHAFALSDEPGEDLKSVGEFAVMLNRYWKASEEGDKIARASERHEHLSNVKEYLEQKRSGNTSAKSFEDYMRARNALAASLARSRMEEELGEFFDEE